MGARQPDRARILAAAVDEAPICVFVADPDMRYVAVNDYACEVLGYTEQELLSMRVPDIAPYPDAPQEYDTMKTSAYLRGVSRIRCKDGVEVSLYYVAGEVLVDGVSLYVSVGQPEFDLAE